MTVEPDTLVDAFQDSVGTGRAEELVERARSSAGLDHKRSLSRDEALAVADAVAAFDDVGTFVEISATTLKTRIRTDDI